MMIELPSKLRSAFSSKIRVTWNGPPHPNGVVSYDIQHQPAMSMTLDDGWYGSSAGINKIYLAASVRFDKAIFDLDTASTAPSKIIRVRPAVYLLHHPC